MPLTNSQYDAILRLYSARQLRNRHEQDARIRQAYEAIPRLSELDSEAAELSLKKARSLLSGGGGADFDLPKALADLADERRALLLSNGFPEDHLELHYDCPNCRDTGFIEGRKCSCFRQAETELLYEQSNLKDALQEDNFDHFSLDYYSDEIISESTGLSARQTAAFALKCARAFIRGFSEQFSNICFYGDTGVGKTFLSHCIAGELIRAGFSVLYLTAFELFEHLEQHKFSGREEDQEAYRHLFACDLLIIDDLGTELTNSFVSSQLFLCINERILRRKSTVISTNLSLEQFAETYSERTFSRIFSHYQMIRLFGHDIRIQKQLSGGK
jgi:DNA replication protein DnaC